MTQDEIIEMVRQSDLGFLLGDSWMLHHELEYFAKLVAAKAIAELESQEPVAWRWQRLGQEWILEGSLKQTPIDVVIVEPLYTHPPQRTWVGLTHEETSGFTQHEMSVVKYVNKVLQEKNT
jgi:hypothetical protein